MAVVLNPAIPYTSHLIGGCRQGYLLHVEGSVPSESSGFAVNLLTSNGDIALHFNPRFNDSLIVLNTNQGGNWQQEQRVPIGSLSRGQKFELKVLVENHGFMIAINGQHHCQFNHRLPLESIQSVSFTGDVKIKLTYHTSAQAPTPISKPGLPITQSIPGGFTHGRKVMVVGKCKEGTFSINLQCGPEPLQHVALHVNPRFNQQCIVLNDRTHGNWGGEERPNLPLHKEQNFTIEIICHSHAYEVVANGVSLTHFAHRNLHVRPLHSVDTLFITGEVKINNVFFA